jgi:hypothetical protein
MINPDLAEITGKVKGDFNWRGEGGNILSDAGSQ